MTTTHRDTDRAARLRMIAHTHRALSNGVRSQLTELITLGRTLERRAVDVLASFTRPGPARPGPSNGPTEASNGRLEHFRGGALGFRNLTSYIARSLLETAG